MCISFYTINPDQTPEIRAYIVRIFKDDELIKTTSFPISNPNDIYRTKKQAEEYGRLTVGAVIQGVNP